MAGRASPRHEPRRQRQGGSGRLPHPPMCLCGCSGPGRLCPPLWGSRGPLGRCPCVAHTRAASCTCAGASASQRPWRPKRLGDDGGSAASRVSPRATAGRRRCTCRRWSSARRPSGSAAAGSTRGRCRTWRSWLPRVGPRRAEGRRQEVVVAGSARAPSVWSAFFHASGPPSTSSTTFRSSVASDVTLLLSWKTYGHVRQKKRMCSSFCGRAGRRQRGARQASGPAVESRRTSRSRRLLQVGQKCMVLLVSASKRAASWRWVWGGYCGPLTRSRCVGCRPATARDAGCLYGHRRVPPSTPRGMRAPARAGATGGYSIGARARRLLVRRPASWRRCLLLGGSSASHAGTRHS